MVNAIGWDKLYDGNLIGAVFFMFDTAFAGWLVAILFIIYQAMLFMKTQNLPLCWVTGLFFAALYVSSTIVHAYSRQVIFVILVLELAGILYIWFFK